MRTLTKSRASVDQDTIMLINEQEVLTKTGIHGQIASVGKGFGTGRHTNKRGVPSPPKNFTTQRGDNKVPKLLIKKTKEEATSVRTHPYMKD